MSNLAVPCRNCSSPVGPYVEITPGEVRVFDHPFMWRCSECGAYGDDSLGVMIYPIGKQAQKDESGKIRYVEHYERAEY